MKLLEPVNTAGARLRIARQSAGYKTAKAFVERFDLSASTYSAHETGQNGLTLKTASFYAKQLGVSTQWLLTGEELSNSESQKTTNMHHLFATEEDNVTAASLDELLHQAYYKDSQLLLAEANIKGNMTVIDACCYHGDMSFVLADMLNSQSKVYAYYSDTSYLTGAIAKARLNNINHLTFQTGSIQSIADADIKADAIYCRLLLPPSLSLDAIIRSLLNTIKKQGTVVIEAVDYSLMAYSTPNPDFKQALEWFASYWQAKGTELDMGCPSGERV